jgi:thermitase
MPSYEALGQRYEITLHPLSGAPAELEMPAPAGAMKKAGRGGRAAARAPKMEVGAIQKAVSDSPVLSQRVSHPSRLAVVQGAAPSRAIAGARRPEPGAMTTPEAETFATETVIAEGMRQADLAAAKNYGASVVEEGLDGKMLLRVDSVDRVFGLVNMLLEREVGSVTPNFMRRLAKVKPAAAPKKAWSHAKIGVADAWKITKGAPGVMVAVLDEGVDTSHPALKAAVHSERDFIGGKGNSAMPDGNDAHGTACAGVVLSRKNTYPGIAPKCNLIAARIAMDDGTGHWVFDDFATADAIDWCWREGAAVLSNSWGGGAPSDAISRAFARARTQGRNGLGAVVAIAAGNDQGPIDFPGDLPGYVTVGASTPNDERKTKTSSDGENWWGSCFGATLHLLAPGVFIWTTDISGAAGYEPGDYTKTFNGTSSATPAVAGAAALMISANAAISASSVRDLLAKTSKKIQGQSSWTPQLGWGRLDVAAAVAAAKVAGTSQPSSGKKKGGKKR